MLYRHWIWQVKDLGFACSARQDHWRFPFTQHPVYRLLDLTACFPTLITLCKERVISGFGMPDMHDDGQFDCLGVQLLGGCSASNPIAEFQAGVFGDDPFSSCWTAGIKFTNFLCKTLDILLILFLSTLGFPLSAPGSRLAVHQALLFGFIKRLGFNK